MPNLLMDPLLSQVQIKEIDKTDASIMNFIVRNNGGYLKKHEKGANIPETWNDKSKFLAIYV
ncbi:MAG: hypothetical protein LN588_02655 [Rickettsia endosymbiont of Bryobia graminum]|nr:hypothetical protein [Rickettsia endosymbiont of Bryobia graminum]